DPEERPPGAPLMPGWTHTGFAQKIVFGEGSLDQLPGLLKELGLRRVMLVTTNGRLASDDGQRVAAKLARSRAATFADVRSHVPTTAVQTAVRQALSDGVDSVVSFGGGSCADLGKAVCFFVEQQAGTPGASFSDRPALPHISIPTTYSGAELTPFFGMTDEAARRKTGSGGPTIAPRAAIYDPVLTLDTTACPNWSGAGPASPTGWPTPCSWPTPFASTPATPPSTNRWRRSASPWAIPTTRPGPSIVSASASGCPASCPMPA